MNFLAEEAEEAEELVESSGAESRFEGPLSMERAIMATATRELSQRLALDTSGYSREELADHSLEICRLSDRIRTGSARFLTYADYNAAALTRGERKMSSLANSQCGVSLRQGRELDLLGAAAERYPLFYQAVLEGRIGPGHIEVLHPVWTKVDRRSFEACQQLLLDVAKVCTPEAFADELAKWRNLADEDPSLRDFLANQAKQHMTYGFDVFGNVHYSGTVGPEHAEPFIETIETEAAKQTTPDTMQVGARGRAIVELILNPDGKYRARLEVLVPKSPPCQDRSVEVEAFTGDRTRWIAMARAAEARKVAMARSVADPNDLGFGGVHVSRTARGTVLPRPIVDRIRLSGAKVTIHMVDADGHIVADQHAGRHFNTVQKRLIRLRDNRCRHAGCRKTALRCEYDHIEPHEHEGPTLIRNGQLLCRFHHRFKHRADPGPTRATIFDDSPLTILLE